MPTKKNGEPLELLSELINTVGVIGVSGTTKLLQKARRVVDLQDETVSFVMTMVSEGFKIPVEVIIGSRDKSNKRKMALQFMCYYLYEVTDYSFNSIGAFVERDKKLVIDYHKALKTKKEDAADTMQRHFKLFDQKVTEFQLQKRKR